MFKSVRACTCVFHVGLVARFFPSKSIRRQLLLIKCHHLQKRSLHNLHKYAEFTSTKHNVNDTLFGWGANTTGAIGSSSQNEPTKHDANHQPCPVELPTATLPRRLAAGNGFSMIACDTPDDLMLYGCGINTHKQIGHSHTEDNSDFLLEPSRISIKLKCSKHLDREPIVSMSCGRSHTWIATNENQAISLGNNTHGQCGRPIKTDGLNRQQEVVFDKQVKQISCGLDHTVVLTECGQVYSCGLGADGQTGLGHYEAVDELTRVCGDIEQENIISVSSRADCSLAVSDKGEVFGWGNSEYGQLTLAVGDEKQVNVARHLPIKVDQKFVSVAAAGTMCCLLDEAGDVYIWGYGALGTSTEIQHTSIPHIIPRMVFNNTGIARLDCGINHFAAISECGELFMWGRQKNFCLGLCTSDSSGCQYSPYHVELAGPVIDMACGYDHTLAICSAT